MVKYYKRVDVVVGKEIMKVLFFVLILKLLMVFSWCCISLLWFLMVVFMVLGYVFYSCVEFLMFVKIIVMRFVGVGIFVLSCLSVEFRGLFFVFWVFFMLVDELLLFWSEV